MKCPYCSSKLETGALDCSTCHAMQVMRRTSIGVMVGWIGVVLTALVAMAWAPLPLMLLAGFDIKSIPWQVASIVISATIMAAGTMWYSRSTRHLEWMRREN